MLPLALIGEDLVCRMYKDRGFRLIGRNIRHTGFELDIVAWKDRQLAIVEVKSRRRRTGDYGMAQTLISQRKLAALARGARYVQSQFNWRIDSIRIDLAVVTFVDLVDSLEVEIHTNIGF